jgi:outer membrane protein TolC
MNGFAAPAEVLRQRPDVRGAEATLIADSARVGVARAQLLPMLNLTGNVGTASAGLSNLFDVITGGLVATVTQLIFDGGRTRAQVKGAEATAQGALAAWRGTILSALEEVESAAVDLKSSQDRVGIEKEALDAANNAAILARSQYQAGLTDFQNLLTAENQLLSARNGVVSAEADQASAFVRLTQALGGGWSPAALPIASNDGIEP